MSAPTSTTAATVINYCKPEPNVCADALNYHVRVNNYDTTSNEICDMANSTPSKFNETNRAVILNNCKTSYAKQNCSSGSNRYKSNFVIKPSKKQLFESFSVSCVDACNSSTASSELQEACKQGSIAYCKTDTNIAEQKCISDSVRYPEIKNILTEWCNYNTTHPKYNSACGGLPIATEISTTNTQASGVNQLTSAPVNPVQANINPVQVIANGENASADEGLSDTSITIIVSIIGFIILIAILGGTWFIIRRKSKTYKPQSFGQPQDLSMFT